MLSDRQTMPLQHGPTNRVRHSTLNTFSILQPASDQMDVHTESGNNISYLANCQAIRCISFTASGAGRW